MSLVREDIVAAARRWIGTPYRHQASLCGVGCDCLGLVRGVWRDVVGHEPEEPPPYTPDWAAEQGRETLLLAAQRHFVEIAADRFGAGDILLFRFRDHTPAQHLGVASRATHMIHAHQGACVAEAAIAPHWRRRIVAVFRFPDVQE